MMRLYLTHMSRWPPVVLWAGVVSVASIVGAVAWHRLTRLTPESDPAAHLAAEGQRAYAMMSTVPVAEDGAVRDVLARASVEDDEGLLVNPAWTIKQPTTTIRIPADQAVAELRNEVSAYLTARLTATGPDAYLSWMRSRGYRLKSVDEFERRHGPLGLQASRIGVEIGSVETLFEASWHHAPSHAATPDALCVGEGAAIITLGSIRPGSLLAPRPQGRLGPDLWIGGSSAGCRFWMQAPLTREAAVEANGRTVAANVGVIVSVPGSARRPLLVHSFFDPTSGRWWIDGVSVQNFIGTDRIWTCTEF